MYLDENKSLILKIVESQNSGKINECAEWYAKRFLHPDIVAPYDYIFIWDEDLGVDNFDSEKYVDLVKKHGLEISQPGVDPNSPFTWQMTRKRHDSWSCIIR
ncbi:uncharacterized protein LOC110730934 [Chenopodium quinoa]|uniref:uncharacterized protein LOC110730934 n=1 Tax=Chenopodium quinoa TaxID=63459 RepID=UPI000B776B8B|nr:uncharacterized protein LOC110730934 [Chenopodium quinoa]